MPEIEIKSYRKRKPLEYVIDENGCWNCISHSCAKTGYPKMRIGSKDFRISRWIYTKTFGEIPNGMVVRHKCDNPACINPEHLELGTQKENIQDCIKRNRFHTCKGGNQLTKLNTKDVLEIRNSNQKVKQIASNYNVSISLIYQIKRGDRRASI